MTDLPAPLVPPDVRFERDESVPLSWESLRWGDLAMVEDVRVFRALVLAMAFSWRGKPAASIGVSKERWFRVCHETPQWWRLHGSEVLNHFVLCSDGKHYHPWLAQVALKRWNSSVSGRQIDVTASEWVRLRAAVFLRDGYRCVYCGMGDVPLHADHVLALSKGGASALENLVTACGPCNTRKGAKHVQEWLR